MTTIINAKIGESKGLPRVWMEGQKLHHGGVQIGKKYTIKADVTAKRLELIEVPFDFSGKHLTVSKRERNGVVHPVIDLRSGQIREVFEEDDKVRIALRRGRIVITALQIQTKIRERLKRIKDKLERGEKLAVASLFHGGGVLDRAIHSGMFRSGVGSFVQVGVEIESEYLDTSLRNNGDLLWAEDSIAICSDIRDVHLGESTPQVDIICGGIPCLGASKSGRSKLGLEFAEDHDDAGALYLDYLNWVRATNPAIVLIENVSEYLNTAAMSAIRNVLNYQGYDVYETVLDGWDFGSLERRKRMVVVAITKGLGDKFSFENLKVNKIRESCINEILDPVPLEDESWKPYQYLAAKEVRDKAAGKGFGRQLLNGTEDGCGVLGAIMVSTLVFHSAEVPEIEAFLDAYSDFDVPYSVLQSKFDFRPRRATTAVSFTNNCDARSRMTGAQAVACGSQKSWEFLPIFPKKLNITAKSDGTYSTWPRDPTSLMAF